MTLDIPIVTDLNCFCSIGFKNIQEDSFYIDKTGFIKEWWNSRDAVTLITRPRRFGKTLNISMLERFFSNRYEGQWEIFEGLSIWEDEKYRELQGTYPVLFLSFAGIKEQNQKDAIENINSKLVALYNQNRFLLEEGSLLLLPCEYLPHGSVPCTFLLIYLQSNTAK